jgi:hypothetical protein
MRRRTILSLIAATLVVGSCSSTEPEATALSFRVQPSDAAAGQSIAPAVLVGFVTGDQTQVTSIDAVITVALIPTTGSAGAILSGTLVVQSVDGVATFSDLSIDQAGIGYQLVASAEGFPVRNSNPFNVSP